MKSINIRILLALILFSTIMKAQDVHFSQFAMSPLLLNPALTGFSSGDYRAYANFRTQWNTIDGGGSAYRTFAGGADMVVGKATKYSSFAGVGLSFFSDQAGNAGFQTNNVALSLAYHLIMNRRRNMSLSFGLKGGFNMRGFDPSKATYDIDFEQGTGNIGNQKESFAKSKVYYGDVAAGLFYSATLKSGSELYLGTALSHINQPMISFYSVATAARNVFNERLYMKFTAHGGATVVLSKKVWLIPNFFLMVQGPASQYNAGAMVKMQLGNKVLSKTYFYLGAQARIAQNMDIPMADAAIFHCRLDYKRVTVGLSYDVNVSKLAASTSTFGAPEISLMYTIAAKRKPTPGYCPAMM